MKFKIFHPTEQDSEALEQEIIDWLRDRNITVVDITQSSAAAAKASRIVFI